MRSPFDAIWLRGPFAQALSLAARLLRDFGGVTWITSGAWDDRAPTSDAWAAAVGWMFDGIWDDAAPTGAATWSAPDGTAYTIWADTEATL